MTLRAGPWDSGNYTNAHLFWTGDVVTLGKLYACNRHYMQHMQCLR